MFGWVVAGEALEEDLVWHGIGGDGEVFFQHALVGHAQAHEGGEGSPVAGLVGGGEGVEEVFVGL